MALRNRELHTTNDDDEVQGIDTLHLGVDAENVHVNSQHIFLGVFFLTASLGQVFFHYDGNIFHLW